MKKLLACMLMTFFVSPIPVISTEKEPILSGNRLYQLSQNVVSETLYYNFIPQNPNLYRVAQTYSDSDLTKLANVLEPNTNFQIKNLLLNKAGIPIFELTNGNYIEASKKLIYSDQILSQSTIAISFWLQDGFIVYNQPVTKDSRPIKTDLVAYQKVNATKIAKTEAGNSYYINGKGWVRQADLSMTDNRMVRVQELLINKYNNSNYSVFVKQLDTQASAGINAEQAMYSASVAKLAILYFVQDKINSGQLQANKTLTYKEEVNKFRGAYDPEGSGQISKKADNNNYTVDDLLQATAKHSDNVATNILGYYLANKYDKAFYQQIDTVSGRHWDMENRKFSAHIAANLMEAIYYQNGTIISYLSDTDFDNQRISKNIPVPVAHKIGDAYDYKHDVAIVYGETPFIISIFTNNASYDDITRISDDVYSILK
ncbi:serine hydrolase [Streptococcus didelphis]|uniref:Serine hydrolase n=1 Tax=Streptococcus didelphis TaxID=102886 RepID=A0ABY9LFD9_9STRE|nr:serine hydrolase [Streptococcus didelphis]WMB27622.1 serine hydrolase [Streptococcus didelphis]WMB29908.1 serine hydrolase [Streptococcus didelphis]